MQLTNNLTYVKGDHTYTLGFSYEKFEFDNSFNLGFFGGTFGFDIDGNGGSRNFASVQEFLDNAGSGGLIDTTMMLQLLLKKLWMVRMVGRWQKPMSDKWHFIFKTNGL